MVKDTKISSMGHVMLPEKMSHDVSEEPYAGPKHSRREKRTQRPVAIIGASADRHKFGNKALRAYAEDGYDVWPVNPKGGEIEGLEVYRNVRDLPGIPYRASIYLHEDDALPVLDELADLQRANDDKIAVVYLNPGADNSRVMQRAADLGMFAVNTCSIQAIGKDPKNFGE